MMFYRSHGEMKDVDVIVIYYIYAIFHVSGFRRVRRKLEVGVGTSLQVYDAACFFFEFSNCTTQWVIDLASATPAGDESPFTVPSVMDNQKVWNVIHCADGYSDRFVPLARSSGI
jgi:hypothetical protein